MAADPGVRVGDIDLLSGEERDRLLVEWNGSGTATPEECLPGAFERVAARCPGAVAVSCGEGDVTYGELEGRANRLARLLVSRGAGPERVVALAVPRSAGMVAAVLGVLKAGAAYLPAYPAYPAERVGFMLADAGPAVVVTTAGAAGVLPGGVPRVVLDDPATLAELEGLSSRALDDEERGGPLRPQNAAYVIYTSGSTGTPKGVVVSHHNVRRLMSSTEHWFGFGPEDVWTLFHSYAFDFSVWEIWGALLYGGRRAA